MLWQIATGTTVFGDDDISIAVGVSYSSSSHELWVNGKLEASTSTAAGADPGIDAITLGCESNGRTWTARANGKIASQLVDLGLFHSRRKWAVDNPWQIFAPIPRNVFADITAGGGVNLVVADSAHAHLADNIALTSNTALSITDANHGHAADSLSLTTQWLLTIAETQHGHSADLIMLATSGAINLIIQEALHAQAADAVLLTADVALTIAEAVHAHLAESVTLGLSNFTQDELDYLLAYMEANMAIWDQPIDGTTTARQLFVMMAKILRNKMITDPVSGTITVFDDDSTTPLLSAPIYKDAAGTTPYNGTGAERRERLA